MTPAPFELMQNICPYNWRANHQNSRLEFLTFHIWELVTELVFERIFECIDRSLLIKNDLCNFALDISVVKEMIR